MRSVLTTNLPWFLSGVLLISGCLGGPGTPGRTGPDASNPNSSPSSTPSESNPGASSGKTAPAPATSGGNGEAYNGPHFEGLAVPPAPDRFFSNEVIERAAGVCLEKLNLDLLEQAFGDSVEKLQMHTYVGTYPNSPSVEDFFSSARSILVFKLRGETALRRIHTSTDLALTENAELRHPALTSFIEPHETRDLSDVPPVNAEMTYFLKLPEGLPRILLDVPPGAEFERVGRLAAKLPVRGVGVQVLHPLGSAVPLTSGFTQKPSAFRVNTESYARCLQTFTETDDEFWRLAPGGARGEFSNDYSRFKKHLAPVLELHRQSLDLSTVAGRAKAQELTWAALGKVADSIFDAYLKGNWTQADANHWANFCTIAKSMLRERDYCEKLSYRVSEKVYQRSHERLSEWGRKVPILSKLMQRAPKPSALARFRIDGKVTGGGYYRGPAFIAANLLEVMPERWWIFFVHELAHSVDDKLIRATHDFSAALRRVKDGDLRPEAVSDLVHLGLDRGLLAEWRAWTITFLVYREAVQAGVWKPIAQAESFMPGPETSAKELARFMLNSLNKESKFRDPLEGVFALPEVSAALKATRKALRAKPALPEAGSLGNLW